MKLNTKDIRELKEGIDEMLDVLHEMTFELKLMKKYLKAKKK